MVTFLCPSPSTDPKDKSFFRQGVEQSHRWASHSSGNVTAGTEEMALHLRAFVGLAEDRGSVLSTHAWKSSSSGSNALFWFLRATELMCSNSHTYVHN